MDEPLTVAELNRRWEKALVATDKEVSRHPDVYRQLKALASDIVNRSLDIGTYLPTTNQLADLFRTLDSSGEKTIFRLFQGCIAPSSIQHLHMLRIECQDLLAYLGVFDQWRIERHRLRVVK